MRRVGAASPDERRYAPEVKGPNGEPDKGRLRIEKRSYLFFCSLCLSVMVNCLARP